MAFKSLTEGFLISPKKLAAVILLNSGTLAWFFLLDSYKMGIWDHLALNNSLLITISQALYYGVAIFSAIIGGLIVYKVDRRKILIAWISVGSLTTISLAFLQGPFFSVVCSLLLGLSLGLGLPTSMAFVADSTGVEERARVSGTVILGTFVLAFLTIGIASVSGFGLIGAILLIAVVRSLSFLALFLDKCTKEKPMQDFRHNRMPLKEFSFYLVPWITFTVTSALAVNLIPQTAQFLSAISVGTILRFGLIGLFGILTGFAADRFGRKSPLIIALLVFAICFVIIGLNMSPATVILFYATSGIAWGSVLMVFLTIPGDLSISRSREIFYAIGNALPLFILLGVSSIQIGDLGAFQRSSFIQILSLVLILSIIPIWRAKETLPESKIRDRWYKKHVNEVGKLREEYKLDK